MRKITVLGSTGSIGTQTLDVVRKNPGDFDVVALTAGSNVERMAEQIAEFHPQYAVMKDEETAGRLKEMVRVSGCKIMSGMDSFVEVSTLPEISIVVAICAFISQLGDLAASAIKRNYKVKDYGHIIPGHGGILDRFDSVIFVAPIIYYVLMAFCYVGYVS